MKLRQRVINWLFEGKAARFYLSEDKHTGSVSSQTFEPEAHVKADRVDPNIATAINVISSSISFLPLDVRLIEYDADGKVQYPDDNDHEANDLIRQPNPIMTTAEFIIYMAQSYILAGNFFCSIEKVKQGELELWPIQPWRVSIRKEASSGIPTGFIIDRHQPTEISYEWDEIIHIRNMNIDNPFYGLPATESLREQILGDYYSDRYNKNFFKNNAVPGSIYIPDQPIDEDQAKMIDKAWNAKNKGIDKAHRNFVLPQPGKVSTPTPPMKDMAFAEYSRINREKIFSVMGIPPFLGGVMEYGNYANTKMQDEAYWRNRVIPWLNVFADGLTRQLMWKYFDEDHVFKFDVSGVHALQGDSLKQAQKLRIACGGPFLTVNEVRDELGHEAVEGGDELRTPSMGGAFAAPAGGNGKSQGEDEKRGALEITLPRVILKNSSSPEKYKSWKAFDDFMRRKEIGYSRVIVGFFNKQKKRVIENLREITSNGLMLRTGLFEMVKFISAKDVPAEDDAGRLFDLSAEEVVLIQSITPFMKKTVYDSGQRVGDMYGLDMVFNLNDPKVTVEIEKMLNRSKLINNTTYENIKRVLKEAQEGAWSLGEIEKGIKGIYREATATRLPMIARTEMLRAVNGGTLMGYQQGGVEKKQWLASLDSNTRDSHANLDGEEVGVNEQFTRGNWPMSYPGDPNAPAAEVINCRCTMIPVITD